MASHPADASISLEFALLALGLGILIFGFILLRLIREWRAETRDSDSTPSDDET